MGWIQYEQRIAELSIIIWETKKYLTNVSVSDSEGSKMIYSEPNLILTIPLAIRDDVKQQSLIITFVNLQDLITVLVRIASLADRSCCKKEKYLDL